MASTAGGAFGFASGLIIQEFGYDDDVDETLRSAATAETGTELVDEDYEDVADSAIVWWRADDGDVDALTDLLLGMAAVHTEGQPDDYLDYMTENLDEIL